MLATLYGEYLQTSSELESFFNESFFDETGNDGDNEDTQHSPSVTNAAQPQLSPLPTSSSDEDISTDDNLSHSAAVDKNSSPPVCTSPEEDTFCACEEGEVRSHNFNKLINYY